MMESLENRSQGASRFLTHALAGSAVVLLAAVFIVVMNTIVDIVYAFLDPRVRLA